MLSFCARLSWNHVAAGVTFGLLWLNTCSPIASGQPLSCKSAGASSVDWFIALKAAGSGTAGSSSYAYLDSVMGSDLQWSRQEALDKVAQTPLAHTLQPLYEGQVGYVLYNDEPAGSYCKNCTSFSLGHAKGVLAFTHEGGFWLIHSAPKFPDSPTNSSYGGIYPGQTKHAQDFLCISLDAAGLEQVGNLLQATDLYIYSPRTLPDNLAAVYPSIARVLADARDPDAPLQPGAVRSNISFASAGGEQFLALTHSSTGLGGEQLRLYEDLVEPALQAGMYVQSWSEGAGNDLPSYCGPPNSTFASQNVKHISIPGTGLAWPTRHARDRDHSKWALTSNATGSRVVCIADQNRARTQEVRGGTAVCFMGNAALWAAFAGIIDAVEECITDSASMLTCQQ